MTGLKPYPDYKKSGLAWLNEIPASWSVHKLGNLFDLQHRQVRADDEIITAFRDGQVTRRRDRRVAGYTEAEKGLGYQGVRKGDLVIHNMDGFAGAIGVADASGKSTPVYSVATPRTGQCAEYFAYLLRHLAQAGYVTSLARGIRERSTDFRWAQAREVAVPVPEVRTQSAIVRFLDKETEEIDSLIADQVSLIALLNERCVAVIGAAVTTGLDRNAPMKKTGVEWLGDIPEHWHVIRVGRAFRLTLGKMVNAGVAGGELHPYLRAGNIQEYGVDLTEVKTMPVTAQEVAALSLEAGDVVVVEGGAGYGRSDVLRLNLDGWVFQNHVIRARPKGAQDPRFFDYFIKNLRARGHFEAIGAYATIPNLSSDKLAAVAYPLLSREEQVSIADYLDRETREMKRAMDDAREVIGILRERRAALIAAVVTGQLQRSASSAASCAFAAEGK
jgi:type I restriction enzyme S subunit